MSALDFWYLSFLVNIIFETICIQTYRVSQENKEIGENKKYDIYYMKGSDIEYQISVTHWISEHLKETKIIYSPQH